MKRRIYIRRHIRRTPKRKEFTSVKAHLRRIDVKEYKLKIDRILRDAKISSPLRRKIVSLKQAISKKRWNTAYELSAVKSKITSKIDEKLLKEYPYQEDSNYNRRILSGYPVYSVLDNLHHDVAFKVKKIPSGMTIL